ncbi:MAG: hypothetical protein IJK15_07165 [Bacteroidaceae bacterium]|nr:hypothetical protein [Bacteroidaceae bacterium]
MKIKSYSLEQLAKNYKVVSSTQSKSLVGGMSLDGEDAYLSYEEMIALYGNPSYFPSDSYPDIDEFLNYFEDYSGTSSSVNWGTVMSDIDYQIAYGVSDENNYYQALMSFYSDKQFKVSWDYVSEYSTLFGFSTDDEPNVNQVWLEQIVNEAAGQSGLEKNSIEMTNFFNWARSTMLSQHVGLMYIAYHFEEVEGGIKVIIRNTSNQQGAEYTLPTV